VSQPGVIWMSLVGNESGLFALRNWKCGASAVLTSRDEAMLVENHLKNSENLL